MAHTYRIFDESSDLESDEQKIERLYNEIKAYEHQHYVFSQEETPDQDVIDRVSIFSDIVTDPDDRAKWHRRSSR